MRASPATTHLDKLRMFKREFPSRNGWRGLRHQSFGTQSLWADTKRREDFYGSNRLWRKGVCSQRESSIAFYLFSRFTSLVPRMARAPLTSTTRSIFLHFSEHKGFSFVSDHVSIRQVKSQSISYLHNEPVAADTSNSHKLLTAIPANKPFHRQHETRAAFCTGALAHDLLVQCTVCQVCECLLTSLLAGRQQFGRAYPG